MPPEQDDPEQDDDADTDDADTIELMKVKARGQ
jgi:hypothetical protein